MHVPYFSYGYELMEVLCGREHENLYFCVKPKQEMEIRESSGWNGIRSSRTKSNITLPMSRRIFEESWFQEVFRDFVPFENEIGSFWSKIHLKNIAFS